MTNRVYVLMLLAALLLATLAQAQTFTTLYSFGGGSSDGGYPDAGVALDPSGNVYGTAEFGGDYAVGVVFELNSAGTETVLHSFSGNPDGANPTAQLIRDKTGNLYGTTISGGSSSFGTVFKIDAAGNETVLYSFTGGSDGCLPYQGVILDKSGNMYGTTYACGAYGQGAIFKVDSGGNFSVLHSFTGYPSEGALPFLGHLVMDTEGNLYGATLNGGAQNNGTAYELSKNGTFILLHSFNYTSSDGCFPFGSVVRDSTGNLYGTTSSCGSSGAGIIWRVSKGGSKETILHNFSYSTSNGCQPDAGVIRDSKGNLYGVTDVCGAHRWGALYELSAKGKFSLLHSFDYKDGGYVQGEALRTSAGTLFGTAVVGGSNGFGTVWKYVP